LQTHVLLLRWDVSKVRGRFGNIGYLRINSVITEINFRCNYMQVFFFKYKSNIKTCVDTISALSNYSFKCFYIVVKDT